MTDQPDRAKAQLIAKRFLFEGLESDRLRADEEDADLLARAYLEAEAEVERLKSKLVAVETTWSEACKAEARDCGCWGRIMDRRISWKAPTP